MSQTDVRPEVASAKLAGIAVRPGQYPPGEQVEIAMIGRSNVGKSSLINSLCRHGGLARTSGTPGKTRTINFFVVNFKLDAERREQFFLVDLPGYGYAKAGRAAKRQWTAFIDEYLAKSPRLRLVCQLIDIRHPPLESDKEAFRRLRELGLNVQLVATKADKLSRMHCRKQLEIIRTGLELPPGERIIAYSSQNGGGRDELLDVISQLLLK